MGATEAACGCLSISEVSSLRALPAVSATGTGTGRALAGAVRRRLLCAASTLRRGRRSPACDAQSTLDNDGSPVLAYEEMVLATSLLPVAFGVLVQL